VRAASAAVPFWTIFVHPLDNTVVHPLDSGCRHRPNGTTVTLADRIADNLARAALAAVAVFVFYVHGPAYLAGWIGLAVVAATATAIADRRAARRAVRYTLWLATR
jgi:hypothetical protein